MSKINAIRIVNLNYNNNTMKIDDEYFELNGENTLFSLMNGGGKTVLVQMVMAPFIRNSKRSLGKRTFKDYFTTNKPTFILVEWQLDGKAGYVLTGMMVRKNQSNDSDFGKEEDLDIINFVHEYKTPNIYDIRNIPIIESIADRKTLKGYQSCEKLLEEIKNKKGSAFSYYNGNSYAQQKNYLEKLEQYQIYHAEWESIIKEVNQKESGLSELFNNAKDEMGLLERWFLKAVDDKLNKNGDRIKSFEELMSKCIKQYKDNKYKILKKQSMLNFKKETESIYKNAVSYQNSIIEKQRTQIDIASLLFVLKELSNNYGLKAIQQQNSINTLNEEITELNYQSLCYNIILKLEELDLLNSNINSLKEDKESCNIELKNIEKSKNLLICAKRYEELQTAYAKVNEYETKLTIINNENIDLTPRRNELGYALKCHYEKEYKKSDSDILGLLDQTEKINSESKQLEAEIKELQGNLAKQSEQSGVINANILSYNSTEDKFSKNYNLRLSRNILGLYEQNFLEQLKMKNEDMLEDFKKSHLSNQKQKYDLEKEKTENGRIIEELIKTVTKLNSDYGIQVNNDKLNEEELEKRRDAIRYINTAIEDVFDTDKIKEEFNKKIKEIENQKKLKEKELDEEQAQYKKLELGKVLEISSELNEAFENEDIRYIYGMDWLKNNGYSKEQNDKMLLENPLIPYSIIVSSKDLIRLRKSNITIFTSQAIPIISKEYLDVDRTEASNIGAIFDVSKELSFYVLFNKNVLDKDSLAKILDEKTQKINQISDIIGRRSNEIREYTDKQNTVIYQSLTKEDYYRCKSEIERLKSVINDSDNILITTKRRQEELTEKTKSIEEAIKYQNEEIKEKERLIKDLLELTDNYNDYLSDLDQKSYLSKQIDEINASISKNQDLRINISKELEHIRDKEISMRVQLEEIKKNNNKYDSFLLSSGEMKDLRSKATELASVDVALLESEFSALSDKISSSQKEVEDNLNTARNNVNTAESSLNKFIKKHNIIGEEYKEIKYDELIEDDLENRKKQADSILADLSEREIPLVKKQGKLENEKEALFNSLKLNFETTEILAKEAIRICDFKKELFDLSIKVEKEDRILKQVYAKNNAYQNNLSALIEYEEYEKLVSNSVDTLSKYEEIELLENNDLNKKISLLKRDLREKLELESSERGNLTDEISRISAIPEFQDDFYKNPLKNLYECRNVPSQVMEQLDTNWKAYSTLLEKLQIDIDIIENEKAEIVNLFTQYVQTVHNNLDSIDRNSSINIRGRSIKMLKIILPSWEDEEGTYKLRVNEFVDNLINSGIELLENNHQIEDMLGKQITIINIYNRVVGCSKVSIRLYKIEANKEVPITWAEAAKNSGGEGFLSAFVILSSLMMYHRRDETDIFLEKEEGKVLIMDNPFAQTSSEHLLKPLMEISKKSNTQLICLSALGGDSIYNRFDNIYVLNHTSSKLQNGISYLKGEHAKGEEITKNMISSRIIAEEAEQMTLF